MLGKILFDKLGVTEPNIVKVDVIPTFKNEDDFRYFVQKIEELDKDPVQVDLYLKAHGLDQVEGLKDYILNNDKLNKDSINELINTQNYKNIAEQAHGYTGVNKAIKKYNELTDIAAKNQLAQTISQTNSNLGKYLTNLKGAEGGIFAYGKSLATATLKTVALEAATMAMNTAISFGISYVISNAISYFSELGKTTEKAREKSTELTQAWQEENAAIDESISKYEELQKKLQDTSLSTEEITATKEELASIQDELVDKYGQEALNIDLVNGKYDEQIAKLKELSKEKANKYLAENYANMQASKDYLNEDYLDISWVQQSNKDILSKMLGADGFNLDEVFEGTREEVYNKLLALYDDVENFYGTESKKGNASKEFISSLLNGFDIEEIENAKETIKAYAEAEILSNDDTRALYDDAINAVEDYNNALASGKGIKQAKANLDSIKEKVTDATNNMSGADEVFQDIWNSISSGADDTTDAINRFNDATNHKVTMISDIDSLTEGFEALDKIYTSIKSKEAFDFKLLNDETFKNTFSGLETYANFIEQIADNPDDIRACQSAFNDLITEWINSKAILEDVTYTNKDLTVSMLEQMGVTNAETVVTQALEKRDASLAAQKILLRNASVDLANATSDEIEALLNEAGSSVKTRTELINLMLAKQELNRTGIATNGDIQSLINLAEAAGVAGEAVANAKLAMQSNSTTFLGKIVGNIKKTLAYDALRAKLLNSTKNNTNYEPIDYTGGSVSNKDTSGGSDTVKTFNWIERAVKSVQRTITNLGKTVWVYFYQL